MKRVLVTGNFNVLHPGHVRLLRFAKECGDKLIVAVTSDQIAGEAAHVPQELRLEGVATNNWVDEAFIMKIPIEDLIKEIKPNVVVKGKEHSKNFNPELEPLNSYGGSLIFGSGESIFSSIDLLKKDLTNLNRDKYKIPADFIDRHDISTDSLQNIIKNFEKIRVCVIGDLIVDEYITCDPLGMSQEDPTIVVTPVDKSKFIGGAAIVAAHASGLGADATLISITGKDSEADFSLRELERSGVNCKLLVDESRPTTLKQRFRSKGKSLLRVSHLHQNSISEDIQEQILIILKSQIKEIDLIVFSDFNYGALPQKLVDKIVNLSKNNGILLAADSQSSSQVGNISRFKNMDLITPTEREARISIRDNEIGLVTVSETLKTDSLAKYILLKMGEEGVFIHSNREREAWTTDRLPALNSSALDTAGAGDSLLITAALSLASESNIWEASLLGSLAASIQVGRIGNVPLQTQELVDQIMS